MPLWLAPQPLVLASKSDVRGKMLAAVGLRFEIRPAQIDERAVEAEAGAPDAAAAAARLLARAKAAVVARSVPGRLVLGADQTLARGTKRFSKPANRAAAAEQLRALRGRTHELHSALALVRDGTVLFDCVDSARLTMRKISDRFIDDYLDMAGPAALASVGAYQLEGIGIHLFERVEGDYFTILGLPLLPLLAYLRQNSFIDG
jgi:septum formation protein